MTTRTLDPALSDPTLAAFDPARVSLSGLRWRGLLNETRYELIASWRQLDFALPTLLFPAMFYLLFGVLFGQGSALATYLVPTYGAFGVIGTAMFGFGVGIAVARESGELRLKRVTPLSPWSLLMAKMITALWFASLVLLELFILAATLGGARFERGEWIGLSVVLLLGTIPFAALGLAIGSHVNGKGAPAIVNLIYLPTAFLSGLGIPLEMLPEFLQKAAVILPPYHLAQLALQVIGNGAGHPWMLHVAVLVAMTLICCVIAVRGLRRG